MIKEWGENQIGWKFDDLLKREEWEELTETAEQILGL
jgi:hypothetical protein